MFQNFCSFTDRNHATYPRWFTPVSEKLPSSQEIPPCWGKKVGGSVRLSPGFSESIRLRRSFFLISRAWLTSRRKKACSLTPFMPNVNGSAPEAITSLSCETLSGKVHYQVHQHQPSHNTPDLVGSKSCNSFKRCSNVMRSSHKYYRQLLTSCSSVLMPLHEARKK